MIVLPSGDLDSISWLSAEVIFDVVDNNRLFQISANSAQIFYVELRAIIVDLVGMLTVEAIRYESSVFIEVVEYLICVVLLTCSEYVDFKVEGQLREEFFG